MQTALTIVGYVVGSYFGYPQLGAIVGAYVGGVLAAPDQTGPRIADTAAQTSSYGVGIARTWGTDRISGSVIWTAPMVEHANEQSGKGGPTITTFSYTRSFAILIGEGPIGAIRRIWADTKLVVDYRDLDDSDAQMGSSLFASYFTFYNGTETQLPDPTIEAVEGAGAVEAYRGRAYIVFTDLPLADYGNRIPQFSFEISPSAPAAATDIGYEPLIVYPWTELSGMPLHSVGETAFRGEVPNTDSTVFTNYQDAADATALAGADDPAPWHPAAVYATKYVSTYTDSSDPTYNREGGANATLDDAQYVYYRQAVEPPEFFRLEVPESSVAEDWLIVSVERKTWVNYGIGHTGEVIAYRAPDYSVFVGPEPPISPAYGVTYAAGSLGGSTGYLVRGAPVLQVRGERVPTHKAKTCYPGDPCTSTEGLGEMPGNGGWCISCDGDISPNYDWTIVSGTAKQLCAIEYRDGALYQNARGPVLLPADPHYADAAWWAARKADAVAAGTMHSDVTSPVVVSSYAQRGPSTAYRVAAGSADLADIVRDICVLSGLSTGQIDVDDLVGQEVLGFTSARRTSARSVIEPLRAAFFFDAVESGNVIRFVRRGGAPVAALTLDDLAAGAEQASEDDPVLSDHGQEAELPRVVSVAYKSVAADYQTGTQEDQRRVGGTEQQVGTEIPIVLDDDSAKQIAQKLLYDSWVERNKRTLSTWRKWSKLEPTDVIVVDDGEFGYRLRITNKSEQQGVITLEACDDDPAVYESAAAGAPVSGGGKVVRVDSPTRYELLDIPLLREIDDSAAFYVAARGYRSDWRGGRLYRSTDGGISFAAYQDLAITSVLGHAETVLGDYAGGNTIDELNTVDVTIVGGGALESITTAQLLNNGNPAVLGDEVIQFKRAVLVDERRYRLSGLLRGRLGTDQHMAAHTSSDRFVLLDSDRLYRPAFELSRLNVELLYKAVSFGLPDTGDGEPFTNTGVALMPLSPVHLNVAMRPEGGYAATWVRRTRFLGPWLDGTDVPLGEASEQYRVRVLDEAGAVVEQHTVTSQSAIIGLGGASLTEPIVFDGFATDMQQVDSPDAIVGIVRTDGGLFANTVRRWNPDGSTDDESSDVGEVIQVAHGDDAIFVIGATHSGLGYGSVTLYRFDYSDVGTPAATRVAASPESLGFRGVAFDGTDLWLVSQEDHELQRCNPTTLAAVESYTYSGEASQIFAVAGWLWINLAGSLVRVDPSDGSVVDSLTSTTATGVYGSPERVFVVSMRSVYQYDATESPSRLLSSLSFLFPEFTSAAEINFGQTLAIGAAGADVTPGVHFFDMTNGLHLVKAETQNACYPAGQHNGNLLASGILLTSTFEWQITGLSSSDLGGMTLEVCQVSETVGAGFPATTIIPEA
jgi:hypothetical protein